MTLQVEYPKRPTAVRRYVVAIITVLLALLLKSFLFNVAHIENVFLVFFSAVVISAWYGGFEPGLLSTVLSALLADYFFVEPMQTFSITPTDLARVFIFISEGFVVSGLSHALRQSRDRYAEENVARLKSEQSLRESEERFRLLVESVPEYAIFGLDTQGNIITWNVGAERITGYRAQEALGKNVSIFYTSEDLAEGKPEYALRTAATEGVYHFEATRVRKDGSRFLANIVLTPIKNSSGVLTGYAKVLRDVTEPRRVEAEIRQLKDELERRVIERTLELQEVNNQLEAFTYTVSHDLRAPLRAIQGFSNILIETHTSQLDESGQDYLRRIGNAAERMDQLIQDLLTYSRLSRAEITLTPVDLDTVVEQVMEQVEAQIEAKQATVKVEYPLARVIGYRVILVQVVSNLLLNALTFARPETPTRVTIRNELRHERVRLWVEDNGIGIEPEHYERIFQMFERLHGIESYPGTGVGLAIVARGMERMNGTYGVEAMVGEGSRFWIELPKAEDADEPAP